MTCWSQPSEQVPTTSCLVRGNCRAIARALKVSRTQNNPLLPSESSRSFTPEEHQLHLSSISGAEASADDDDSHEGKHSVMQAFYNVPLRAGCMP